MLFAGANVLVSQSLEIVKVIDFGEAIRLQSAESMVQGIKGTIPFAVPG